MPALTVAGSDSGAGAGIQADLAAMRARGVFGTSALTAVTAQNTTGVRESEALPPETVAAQIEAVAEDFDIRAAKTGMLAEPAVVRAVADALPNCPLVLDPVVLAGSGDRLLTEAGVETLCERLLPAATLVTPNRPEAELLAGTSIASTEDAADAGAALRGMGADAALVTGGHGEGPVCDVLVTDDGVRTFEHPRYDGTAHGSGCALSASVTAGLARGDGLETAVADAIDHVVRAVRFGYEVGGSTNPVNPDAVRDAAAGVIDTITAVGDCVRAFESNPSVSRVVPEVGLQVAVAPPCATSPAEIVAVDGRLHRTAGGVRAVGGPRPGASSHIARLLCGVRAADSTVSAACNVRRNDAIVATLRERCELVTVDRRAEPDDVAGTMDWVAKEVMETRADAPDAIADTGADGKEPMVRLLADDAATLRARVLELADAR